jgi:hypothetical protein
MLRRDSEGSFFMKKPNVLLVIDTNDISQVESELDSDRWNLSSVIVDYDRLNAGTPYLRRQIVENNVDFVQFSRNDQVAGHVPIGPIVRKLGVGYSTFSGIDQEKRVSQMKTCLGDFLACENSLDFLDFDDSKVAMYQNRSIGTFSICFDTEQIACVRYGIPRLLKLLDKYGIRSNFFITNLMKIVYPGI